MSKSIKKSVALLEYKKKEKKRQSKKNAAKVSLGGSSVYSSAYDKLEPARRVRIAIGIQAHVAACIPEQRSTSEKKRPS